MTFRRRPRPRRPSNGGRPTSNCSASTPRASRTPGSRGNSARRSDGRRIAVCGRRPTWPPILIGTATSGDKDACLTSSVGGTGLAALRGRLRDVISQSNASDCQVVAATALRSRESLRLAAECLNRAGETVASPRWRRVGRRRSAHWRLVGTGRRGRRGLHRRHSRPHLQPFLHRQIDSGMQARKRPYVIPAYRFGSRYRRLSS